MKCLRLTGEQDLMERFTVQIRSALPDLTICIVRRDVNGSSIISIPAAKDTASMLRSMPPDLALVTGDDSLIAPVILCSSSGSEGELVLAQYTGDMGREDFESILERTFPLLPQKTHEECGRCGLGCRGLAEAVLRGEMNYHDCFYSGGGVEIFSNGRPVTVGKFPAQMIEGSVRGMLSALKECRGNGEVIIRVGEES